jgi:CheY-like chemotaxis protein
MHAFGEGIPKASRISERAEEIADLRDIRGAQILLVEDNQINQQVAREILQGAGLIVTVANNGQEGVDAAMQTRYDAILMDIQMPVMDGYTASREIRNLKSEIRNVPIIAMTAHAMAGDEAKSMQAGMNDHITKPIDPVQMFATLQKWIKPLAERAAIQKPAAGDKPREPDHAVSDKGELPEFLPGFDLAAGLTRLMGNKRLYRKLLLDFEANFGGVTDEIREAIDAKDFEQAHSLVHNLKGLAGNLEATDLQAAAVEMEKLVRGQTAETTSDKELKRKFSELENVIQHALNAVKTIDPIVEKKTIGIRKAAIASLPLDLLQKVTESIKAAVELGDVIKIKSIAEELKLETDTLAPFCDELVRLAEDFDFDGIHNLMLELNS